MPLEPRTRSTAFAHAQNPSSAPSIAAAVRSLLHRRSAAPRRVPAASELRVEVSSIAEPFFSLLYPLCVARYRSPEQDYAAEPPLAVARSRLATPAPCRPRNRVPRAACSLYVQSPRQIELGNALMRYSGVIAAVFTRRWRLAPPPRVPFVLNRPICF